MGLYGVEATCAASAAVNRLRIAIANALAPRSHLRAVQMAFEVGTVGEDLDPIVEIFAEGS